MTTIVLHWLTGCEPGVESRNGAEQDPAGTERAEENPTANEFGDQNGKDDSSTDKESSEGPANGSSLPKDHTVLIIDDGFDLDHPVFEGKIVASYTLSCDESAADAIDESLSKSGKIKAYISFYKKKDDSCTLKKGIKFAAPKELARFSGQRQAWNNGIRNKSIDPDGRQYRELRQALVGATAKRNYHGTKTASVIAYQNPRAKIVAVQLELRTPGEDIVNSSSDCPNQRAVDEWIEIHEDPAVRKAYIQSPIPSIVREIEAIAEEHQVTLMNLSLGGLTRKELEAQLADAGCGNLDYREQYQLEGDLDEAQEEYRLKNNLYQYDLLTIQSAGNDGNAIDSRADSAECGNPENNHLLIGAYDSAGKRSSFSNYGDCVQYYMLGKDVVVAAPEGFLDVSSGTSFAAPLVTRYLSMATKPVPVLDDLVDHLDEKADAKGFLKTTLYPNEIAFQNSKTISEFALTPKNIRGIGKGLSVMARRLKPAATRFPVNGIRRYETVPSAKNRHRE